MEEILDVLTDIVAPELLPVLELAELATDAMLAPDSLETINMVNETGEYVSKAADAAMKVIGPGAVVGGVASGAFSGGAGPFPTVPGQKTESIGSGELPQLPALPGQPSVVYDPSGGAVPKVVYEPFKAERAPYWGSSTNFAGSVHLYGTGCMGGCQFLRPKSRRKKKRNKIYMM